MMRDEILEYPYTGIIYRVVHGRGNRDDSEYVLYNGVMDEHLVTAEEGKTLQSSSYIISIPLTKTSSATRGDFDMSFNGDFHVNVTQDAKWIIPRKGDKITVTRYGETFSLVVDNAEPSQLGGVSIYATRNSWQV